MKDLFTKNWGKGYTNRKAKRKIKNSKEVKSP